MGFLVGTGIETQKEREAKIIRNQTMANAILEHIDRLGVKLEEDGKKISSSFKLTQLNKKYSRKFIKLQNLQSIKYVSQSLANIYKKRELEGFPIYNWHVVKHPLLESNFHSKLLDEDRVYNIAVPVKDGLIIIQHEDEQNIKRLRKIKIVETQMQEIEQEMAMYGVNPSAKIENDIISGISKVKRLVPGTINNPIATFRNIRF